MIKAKINNEEIDPFLKYQFIPNLREYMKKADDDYLLLAIGDTGTGKSSLFLHVLEQFMGERASVDFVGLDKQQIADALSAVNRAEHPRGWISDEANFSKRDSMSKFNKDLIDMYLSIRGLNILHLWCNPSLDMIDKFFVEEKIKGVFLCTSKADGRRPYFYFEKKDILAIFNKYGNLKIETIKKVRKKYAKVIGWYRKYEGHLNKKYLEMKKKRMEHKVNLFQEKWGTSIWLDLNQVCAHIGVSKTTIKIYLKDLTAQGRLKEGVDYKMQGARYLFHSDKLGELEDRYKEMKKRRFDVSQKNEKFKAMMGKRANNLKR